MKRPPAHVVRFARRVTTAVVIVTLVILIAAQFSKIVLKNVAMAHDVAAARRSIGDLQRRARDQRRTLRRLASAEGAIPEIHARLRLVRPHEEIIYVRGVAEAPGGS